MSPSFKTVTPHLINVPNRYAIEIHTANYPSDVHGCIGVGSIAGNNFISGSDTAFRNLMFKLEKQEDITIKVVNGGVNV